MHIIATCYNITLEENAEGKGMIDLHTHILPEIDDGAIDLYDSLEMARIAVESGTTAMVVTPHCNIPGMFENHFGEEYIEVFQMLDKALEESAIPLKIYPGMEVFITPDVPELLSKGKLLTINKSRYILVEFAFDEDVSYVQRMLKKIKELGLRPIIAHPERYIFVQEDLQMVYRWRKQGYLIQLNKGSLMGRFGRRAEYAAHSILRHNLVSVIASDAHGVFQRTPYMKDVYEELLEEYPEKYLWVLFEENPRRICEDLPTVKFELKSYNEEAW